MKSKITLLAILLLSWGSFAQAQGHDCPCVDKETLAINQAYHEGALGLDSAVVDRLQNAELIAMVNAASYDHQAKLKELNAISINAGIPFKPSDLSQGFSARASKSAILMKGQSGDDLDHAYLDFRANELQRLLTAFDTYFITDVTTPTMKAWVKPERARLMEQYNAIRTLQQKIMGFVAISN
ncbi:MAG: DUF4142 domain-containing protein [Bdellovibrionales bacterium]|nr:DUF4142 domain-containing protein [Oligoflexia bacterium]